jgi:hypothetical protein
MITFSVIDKDGCTYVDDPRLHAYRHMAWLASVGRGYTLIVDGGRFTVKADGCDPLTFCPVEE